MIRQILLPVTITRYYYKLGFTGIKVIYKEGWHSFFKKVRYWFHHRRGDIFIVGRADNADKVANLWGKKAHDTLNDRNKLVSWDCHPYTIAYINRRISGNVNESWIQFVKRRFCPEPLNTGLSLGSGWGGLERDALNLHICQSFDAYDISPQAIKLAQTESLKQGFEHRINYYCADLNNITLESDKYDICFAAAVLHHIENLEYLIEQIHNSLHPGGLFVIIEYVGPARYQWNDKVENLMNRILIVLPNNYKISLNDNVTIKGEVKRPSVQDVITVDPSEAIRPEEILPEIQKKFKIIYNANFGGTLLCFTLADIIGNFQEDNPKDKAILELMILLEETLIDEKVIPSDFTFVVAQRKD